LASGCGGGTSEGSFTSATALQFTRELILFGHCAGSTCPLARRSLAQVSQSAALGARPTIMGKIDLRPKRFRVTARNEWGDIVALETNDRARAKEALDEFEERYRDATQETQRWI
jgi:hypothetical protein